MEDTDYKMSCNRTLTGFWSKHVNSKGKRQIVFDSKLALDDREVNIPCGNCVGCRLEKSRQWAMRCVLEASLYKRNCFITLTYKDLNNWSLNKRDFVLFMKRLRKRYGNNIRYYHCGEYGEENNRPHHHALIFNHDFEDKRLYSSHRGNDLYRSWELERLWTHGFSTIGEVTFDSAAYVARYIMKKQNGVNAEQHYDWITEIDFETGEAKRGALPEYNSMSRNKGIGTAWIEKYKDDIYPKDYIVLNGKKMRPPKFFDEWLRKNDPYLYDQVKENRYLESLEVERTIQDEDRNEGYIKEKLKLKTRSI